MSAESTRIEVLGRSLRALPDVLVTAQLDLIKLRESQSGKLSDEARAGMENVSALISRSLGIVMTALEYIDEWTEGDADQTRPPLHTRDGGGPRKVS